ncbi:leucyl aminopeptidase [Planctomicrobium piriforme]|uniref:Probable cytosol aminopeptidase n=1 Tax=Planctomicrobium piriforme TaxID=1576369 RepID=A0A1I3RNR7_9PLAN|nr:leucyl aminopeptidase [Planctomicrobium piriforme]SFJ46907.1 leucyl aminopeptidase [Planctomicrobium piriforme]
MSALLPQLVTTPLPQIKTDWLLVALPEQPDLPTELQGLDQALGGALSRLRERGDIKGKSGELTVLPVAPGIQAERLLVLGLGPIEKLTLAKWEQGVLTGIRKASGLEATSMVVAIPSAVAKQLGADQAAATVAYASIVGSCGQGLYKAEADRFCFREVSIHPGEATVLPSALDRGRVLGESVNLVRELVNRQPEEIVPDTFASRAAEVATSVGLQGEIFDVPRLQQERMGSLLAVSRGSAHAPRVVILKYQGAGEGAPWLALVGKGVTFDSGGLSLKPSDSMLSMKGDMAGAATVLGAMAAIARLKLPVNVIGSMGLVENMIGPHSYKMGEILTARNGTTIEVHNTDAEGRLVLADVLCYTVDQKPACLIDLATLTGSCMVALGMDIAGAFSNNQDWCDDVVAAARRSGEEVWQMPMNDSFNDQLKCDFADLKNVGTRWGGSITAAKFLERFVDGTPWVHLDIAGPSYAETSKPYRDPGATGSSLRTLVEVAEAFATRQTKFQPK